MSVLRIGLISLVLWGTVGSVDMPPTETERRGLAEARDAAPAEVTGGCGDCEWEEDDTRYYCRGSGHPDIAPYCSGTAPGGFHCITCGSFTPPEDQDQDDEQLNAFAGAALTLDGSHPQDLHHQAALSSHPEWGDQFAHGVSVARNACTEEITAWHFTEEKERQMRLATSVLDL